MTTFHIYLDGRRLMPKNHPQLVKADEYSAHEMVLVFPPSIFAQVLPIGEMEVVVDVFEHGVLLKTLSGTTKIAGRWDRMPYDMRETQDADEYPDGTIIAELAE